MKTKLIFTVGGVAALGAVVKGTYNISKLVSYGSNDTIKKGIDRVVERRIARNQFFWPTVKTCDEIRCEMMSIQEGF